MFHCLPDGNLAEAAGQLGKRVEHRNQSQPNPSLSSLGTPCSVAFSGENCQFETKALFSCDFPVLFYSVVVISGPKPKAHTTTPRTWTVTAISAATSAFIPRLCRSLLLLLFLHFSAPLLTDAAIGRLPSIGATAGAGGPGLRGPWDLEVPGT